jgi:hypothetical protein
MGIHPRCRIGYQTKRNGGDPLDHDALPRGIPT